MIGASSGALDLIVGGGHIDFDAIPEMKVGRGDILIQSFLCCLSNEVFVRGSETMECFDGGAQCRDENLR